MTSRHLLLILALCMLPMLTFSQTAVPYQSDFPPEEFLERRAKVYEHLGSQAFALLQAAPEVDGFKAFRQSNSFYYLSGIETPHSYLLLDGRTRTTALYLPHRDEARERSEGKRLAAEDAELVKKLTGIEEVFGVELLPRHLIGRGLIRPPAPVLYTEFSPLETGSDSRDELLSGQAGISSDPWDGRPSRQGHFIHLLKSRYPQFEIRDLSPILDQLRTIKSAREIALIRRASEIAGLGLVEAMRSTRPGVYEYQLEAAARYIFQINGARREGYNAIVGGGTNAWMGHYFANNAPLRDGDMVLMDYAPEYRYYTSDIARAWPVNGKYTPEQRALGEFILAYRQALLRPIRPGVTSNDILDLAAQEMATYLAAHPFAKPAHQKAAEAALKFRGHFQHPVGMAVHDVGQVRNVPLQPGMVFTIDPMMWIPEEKQYIRIEDVIAVTENGYVNFTDFIPAKLDDIERTIRQQGVLEFRPAEK